MQTLRQDFELICANAVKFNKVKLYSPSTFNIVSLFFILIYGIYSVAIKCGRHRWCFSCEEAMC